MILVDTSVWIDHLRRGNARLAELLRNGEVLCHPCDVHLLASARIVGAPLLTLDRRLATVATRLRVSA